MTSQVGGDSCEVEVEEGEGLLLSDEEFEEMRRETSVRVTTTAALNKMFSCLFEIQTFNSVVAGAALGNHLRRRRTGFGEERELLSVTSRESRQQ